MDKLKDLLEKSDKPLTFRQLCVTLALRTDECRSLLDRFIAEYDDISNYSISYLVCGMKNSNFIVKLIDAANLPSCESMFDQVLLTEVFKISRKNIDDNACTTESVISLNQKFSSIFCEDVILKTLKNLTTNSVAPASVKVNETEAKKDMPSSSLFNHIEKPNSNEQLDSFLKREDPVISSEGHSKISKKEDHGKKLISTRSQSSSAKSGENSALISVRSTSSGHKVEIPLKMLKEKRHRRPIIEDDSTDEEDEEEKSFVADSPVKKVKSSFLKSDKSHNVEKSISDENLSSSKTIDAEEAITATKLGNNNVVENAVVKKEEIAKSALSNDVGSNLNSPPRIKKRQQVTKTFLDDNGYMVTEKVWEETEVTEEMKENLYGGKHVDEIKNNNTQEKAHTSGERDLTMKKMPTNITKTKKKGSKSNQSSILGFFKKL